MEVELDLLQRYALNGDRDAMQILIRTHRPLVFATCRRYFWCDADAEDAMQEVFLSFMANASNIKSNVGAWLCRCAKNTAISMIRARRSRRSCEIERSRLIFANCQDMDALQWERLALLEDCLRQLDVSDRSLLLQNYVSGLTQKEIASSLGISQQAVAKRIGNAMTRMRRVLSSGRGAVGIIGVTLLLGRRLAAAAFPQGLRTWGMTLGASVPATVKVSVAVTVVATATVVTYESSERAAGQTAPNSMSNKDAPSLTPAHGIARMAPRGLIARAAGASSVAQVALPTPTLSPQSQASVPPNHHAVNLSSSDRLYVDRRKSYDEGPELQHAAPPLSNSQLDFVATTSGNGSSIGRLVASHTDMTAPRAVASPSANNEISDPLSTDVADSAAANPTLGGDPFMSPSQSTAGLADSTAQDTSTQPISPVSHELRSPRQEVTAFGQSPRPRPLMDSGGLPSLFTSSPSDSPPLRMLRFGMVHQASTTDSPSIANGAVVSVSLSDFACSNLESSRQASLIQDLLIAAPPVHSISDRTVGPLAGLASERYPFPDHVMFTSEHFTSGDPATARFDGALDSIYSTNSSLGFDPARELDAIPIDGFMPHFAEDALLSGSHLNRMLTPAMLPLFATGYRGSISDSNSGAGFMAAPEPGSLVLMVPLALWGLRRRRDA